MVERIAGWSTRHRKIAVFGWLAMVLAIVALGQLMGSRNLPVYDPATPARASRRCTSVAPATLNQLSESVFVQGRPGAATFPRNQEMQQAARQVVAALAALPRDAGSHPVAVDRG